MGHMREEDTVPYENFFWKKNRIDLLEAKVTEINYSNKTLSTDTGTEISYDKLIIATGSKTIYRGWQGEQLKGVGGLYSLQDLNQIERLSPHINQAVIVGGGLIGIELAEMFRSRNKSVTMLVRENSYWNNILPPEESALINEHIKDHGIELLLEEELETIHGEDTVTSITTKSGKTIPCEYVGISTGVAANVSWLSNGDLNINRGIVVNTFLETNLADVYAIGDCAQLNQPDQGRRPIEAVWYTARMMGEVVAYNICGKRIPYHPGTWFNSAKFLDVEYQVYGEVPTTYDEVTKSIYWQHKNDPKSIRIVYRNNKVIGFNLMGIRYRQEVCIKWIESKTHIETVLQELSLANFDPEFFETYEQHLIDQYNKHNGTMLKARKKGVLNEVLNFLKS